MAESPNLHSDGVLRVSILSDGKAISDSVEVLQVRVQRRANQVPTARLTIMDGDMAAGAWPIADAATFAPGAAITIKAGYGDREETIFEGLVVKLGSRISGANDARLIIDCQDKAVKMTVGRKNANYIDKTDSEIMQSLAGAHGLTAKIEATTAKFQELTQYYCSDWDFLVARAEVNGQLVIANDGNLSVAAPAVDGAAVLRVTYGADLMEFQGEIDARTQLSSVQAFAWNPKNQAIAEGEAATPPSLNEQGNLDGATLAKVVGLSSYRLQIGTVLDTSVLGSWAKAMQVKSGLSRIRGRMKFQGHAAAKVGTLIEIAGVGERYSGTVFVGGVEHEIADGNWVTDVDFGLSPDWFTGRSDVMAPPASGWLPGADGLQVGVVTKLDGDPQGEQRIQVKTPVLAAESPAVWARLAQYHASSGFGAFLVPEIGDEVVLGFFNNDPSSPVILGSLYSSNRAPPYALEAENNTKAWVSRCLAKIEIDDKDKVITITTPGNNKAVLSDKDRSILVQDQSNNKVKLSESGIELDSPKDIKLTAKGSLTLDAVGTVSIASKADVSVKGLNVACEAQVALTAKGSASAELSASGQTTVRGAMVMIN